MADAVPEAVEAQNAPPPGQMRRLLYLGFGWLCVGLAVAGAVLPVLPTTPFLLLAAWAFSRSSRRFHDWLLNHPRFGPPVKAWREHGAIPAKAKVLAVAMMACSLAYLGLFSAAHWAVPVAAGTVMAAVAVFILTRPSLPGAQETAESEAAAGE